MGGHYFPKPKSGPKGYWCPGCKMTHFRNSRIGNLHKPLIEQARMLRKQARENRHVSKPKAKPR